MMVVQLALQVLQNDILLKGLNKSTTALVKTRMTIRAISLCVVSTSNGFCQMGDAVATDAANMTHSMLIPMIIGLKTRVTTVAYAEAAKDLTAPAVFRLAIAPGLRLRPTRHRVRTAP